MVKVIIALDVHKNTVYVTEMLEDGYVKEQYDIGNDEEAWKEFTEKYSLLKPQIALEVSTSGKYVARMLRNNGFSVHMADASKLSLIFNSPKKNDREDSYKLAKLLRLGELPEVHLPSEGSDNLKSLVRYRRSLGQGDDGDKEQDSRDSCSARVKNRCNRHLWKKGSEGD